MERRSCAVYLEGEEREGKGSGLERGGYIDRWMDT